VQQPPIRLLRMRESIRVHLDPQGSPPLAPAFLGSELGADTIQSDTDGGPLTTSVPKELQRVQTVFSVCSARDSVAERNI